MARKNTTYTMLEDSEEVEHHGISRWLSHARLAPPVLLYALSSSSAISSLPPASSSASSSALANISSTSLAPVISVERRGPLARTVTFAGPCASPHFTG